MFRMIDFINLRFRLTKVGLLLAAAAADWEAESHPRAKDGKFAPKAESGDTAPAPATETPAPLAESDHLGKLQASIASYRDMMSSIDDIDLGSDPAGAALKDHMKTEIEAHVKQLADDILGPASKQLDQEKATDHQQRQAQEPEDPLLTRAKQSEAAAKGRRQVTQQLFTDGAALIAGVTAGVVSEFSSQPPPDWKPKDAVPGKAGEAQKLLDDSKKRTTELIKSVKDWYAKAAKSGEAKKVRTDLALQKAKAKADQAKKSGKGSAGNLMHHLLHPQWKAKVDQAAKGMGVPLQSSGSSPKR